MTKLDACQTKYDNRTPDDDMPIVVQRDDDEDIDYDDDDLPDYDFGDY